MNELKGREREKKYITHVPPAQGVNLNEPYSMLIYKYIRIGVDGDNGDDSQAVRGSRGGFLYLLHGRFRVSGVDDRLCEWMKGWDKI